jgi:hypothetical protein
MAIFVGVALGLSFPFYVIYASTEGGSSPPPEEDVTKNLAVPYYSQQFTHYCGPASAQMWIDYGTGNLISQDELYDYIRANNLEGNIWFTDPYGLQATLDSYIPTHAHWDQKYSSASSGTFDVVQRIEWYSVPGATLTYNGDHWMLVKGAYYRKDSYDTVTSVYGVYVHDPWAWDGGIGSNTYVVASNWNTNYFTVVDAPGSQWNGYWVAVVCPPRGVDTVPSEIYIEPQRGPVSKDEAVQVAIEGLNNHQLFVTEPFARYLDGAVPREPFYVKSISNNFPNYYLVPFARDGRISAVAIINAELGTFMEASYSESGLTKYPALSAEDASVVVEQIFGETSYVQVRELVWKPSEQSWRPYAPFWAVEVDGETVYVGQNGQLYKQLSLSKHPPITPTKSELRMPTDTVQMIPTDDAHVAEGYPDNNFGDRMALFIQSRTTGYKNERIFLKFDLATVPADSKVVQAKLYLYCWRGKYASLDLQCYSVNVDSTWEEGTITWNNKPALEEVLDTVILENLAAENKWHSWDVTKFVASEFAGDKVVSFCLKVSVESLSGQYAFESKEWWDARLHPYLEVTYTRQ